jgi:hypothetical protein
LSHISFFKKTFGLIVVAFFVILFLPGQTIAQEQTGTMMGVVYKKDIKTPFKKCRVVLMTIEKDKEKEKRYQSEPTDDNGNYEIKEVPAGVYKVGLITKSGKKPTKTLTVVNIVAGQVLERSFFYKPRKPLLAYWNCFIAVIFFGIFIVL